MGVVLEHIWREVRDEVNRACEKFPDSFASNHEGFAILLEEVHELWEEVRRGDPRRTANPEQLRREALQVAAMAVRFIHDRCDKEWTTNL